MDCALRNVSIERLMMMGRHKSQPQRLNKLVFNQIRRKKGYTIEQLASQINYSYDAVAQWAWKGRPLRSDSIEALEKCLGVDRKVFLLQGVNK